MSGKHNSEKVDEPAKKLKLEVEISTKIMDTKKFPDIIWQQIFGFFSLKEVKLIMARVCRHFYDISNDCVRKIVINEKMFASDNKYEMYNALPTFKYLKTIEIGSNKLQALGVEFFLLKALKYCPRLRHIGITDHKLSIGFVNQIVKHGQNLYGLKLNFMDTHGTSVFDLANLVLRGLNRRFSSSVDSGMSTCRFTLFPIFRNFAMHAAYKN